MTHAMTQGVLPFKYEEEKTQTGMTALAGLPVLILLSGIGRFPYLISAI